MSDEPGEAMDELELMDERDGRQCSRCGEWHAPDQGDTPGLFPTPPRPQLIRQLAAQDRWQHESLRGTAGQRDAVGVHFGVFPTPVAVREAMLLVYGQA